VTIRWLQGLRRNLGVNALLTLLTLTAGAAALFAVRSYLDQEVRRIEAGSEARYRPEAVVVASRDIDAGQPISVEQLAVRRMPQAFLPASALRQEMAGELVGRRLLIPARRGDALTRAALAPAAATSLAEELPEGFRAVTLAVDDIRSHAGLVKAGDEVDLFLMQERGDRSGRLTVLLERVPVIATGERLRDPSQEVGGSAYGTLTLRASAADAARVLLAEQAGRLSVLLRARGMPRRWSLPCAIPASC